MLSIIYYTIICEVRKLFLIIVQLAISAIFIACFHILFSMNTCFFQEKQLSLIFALINFSLYHHLELAVPLRLYSRNIKAKMVAEIAKIVAFTHTQNASQPVITLSESNLSFFEYRILPDITKPIMPAMK